MKTCEPEKDKVLLECNPNSMTIKVNKCVAPDAVDVTLNDSTCKTSSSAGDFYELTTELDSCETALSQSSEGDLVFANEVYASPQQNSIIFTSAETRITFHCSYQAVYHDISAEHIVHTAEFNGGEEGSGKLAFSIVKHSDRHFDSPLDNDAVSIVGDTIFFTVDIETPIVGVEFAIAECTVRDDNIGKNFTIIEDGCMEGFVNVKSNAARLSGTKNVGISFTAFQFLEADDDVATLKIACTAIACAADEDGTFCKENTCDDSGRRRRTTFEETFSVSNAVKISKAVKST